MRSYWYNVKKYFPFTRPEQKALLITIAVLTFITAFNDRSESFQFAHWFSNMLLVLIMVVSTVLVHQLGYRLLAIKVGFQVEYQIWWFGLGAAVIACLITNGNVLLLIPGGFIVHHLEVGRLFYFRYGINTFPVAMIALMGCLANIFFGTFLKQINIWFFANSNLWLDRYFVYNLLFAALNLLPIPPLDGSRVLFNSRLIYAFLFGAFAGYAVLAWLGLYSYVLAILIGGLAWLLFYVRVEVK